MFKTYFIPLVFFHSNYLKCSRLAYFIPPNFFHSNYLKCSRLAFFFPPSFFSLKLPEMFSSILIHHL